MEPARFTQGDRPQRRSRALVLPQGASPNSPFFCIIFMWLSELTAAGKVDVSLESGAGPQGSFKLSSALAPGHPARCTASSAGFAAWWPRPSLAPPPRRPRRACEGLIPTASDKGSSCKTLICCLQTRLWGMLENLKVNVSLASGIK